MISVEGLMLTSYRLLFQMSRPVLLTLFQMLWFVDFLHNIDSFVAGAVISPSMEDSWTFSVNAANSEVYKLRGSFFHPALCDLQIKRNTGRSGCSHPKIEHLHYLTWHEASGVILLENFRLDEAYNEFIAVFQHLMQKNAKVGYRIYGKLQNILLIK